MNHFRQQLQAAGLASTNPHAALIIILAISAVTAIWVQLTLRIVGLSFCSFLITLGLLLESLSIRAKARSDSIAKLWPEVIDSLLSGASSNLSLIESLGDLSENGPEKLRPSFQGFVSRVDSGWKFEDALEWLKKEFGQVHADRLLELIWVTKTSGGTGYISSLRRQSKITRDEIALWGELESKQGWIQGTAKLAVVSPWIIVAILGNRPENANVFNSAEGITILLVGLVVSIFAYRLILLLGRLSRPIRIFTP